MTGPQQATPHGARAIDYPVARIALPDAWHAVTEVVVRGTTLYYRLGEPKPLREDGRYRHDARERVALEAFLGLPLDAMFDRLDAYHATLIDRAAEADPDRYREVFCELVAFVETFGPLGLDWSRLHQVVVADADRLIEENWRLSLALAGLDASAPPPAVGTPVWRATFPEPGQPFLPTVERVISYPDLPWEERVRRSDSRIVRDEIGGPAGGPLAWAMADLRAAVELGDALAGRDKFRVRDAIRAMPLNPVFDISEHATRSPLALDWRTANRGVTRAQGRFEPFAMHEAQVDWFTLGRLVFAEHCSSKLSLTTVGVGIRDGVPAIGWRIGSLLDVMYLQLLDQVRRRPDFGIVACGLCRMPILRSRRKQRWHTGCAPTGRQRESRAARRSRGPGPGGAS